MISGLHTLFIDKEWHEVRKYVSSDAAEEEKRSNTMYYNRYGTCLHVACYRDAPDDIIKTIIDIGGKELVMSIDKVNRTALHSACCNGASRHYIIKILIGVGGKDLVMAKSENGNTALHWLCYNIKRHTNAAETIRLLLQVGDDNLLLTTKNKAGNTPLEIADQGASKKSKASKKIKKLRTLLSTSTKNNNKTSANVITVDNGNNEEQQTTKKSSTNTNNDPKGTTHQKLQRQLIESQKAAKKFRQDYGKKCEDYSGLKKKVKAQRAEMCTLLMQNITFEKDIVSLKGRVDNFMQICSEHEANLQEMKDVANAPIAGIQMIKQEAVEASNVNQLLEESNKKATDLVATVEAQSVRIVALSNEKDDIEKECGDEVDKLTQICLQQREELQLMFDCRNRESTKRKHRDEEHQEEEGSVAVSQSQSRSSKRSRLGSTTNAALGISYVLRTRDFFRCHDLERRRIPCRIKAG